VRPTRVLMTTDTGTTTWIYSLDLARGLLGRGIDVVLATMGAAPTSAQRTAARAVGAHLEHAPLRLEWMADPWRDVASAGEWLLGLERRHGCDLVHLNGYALARCEFASPKIVTAHSCMLSWWESVLREPAPSQWTPYRQAVSEGIAAASHVVAPTRWMRQAIERHYGAQVRASVIHHARVPGVFASGPKHPFVLGAGGVWDEAKNLATLARAGRSLPWPVKIAGPLTPPHPANEADEADDADHSDGARDDEGPQDQGGPPDAEAFDGVELLGAVPPDEMAELYARAPIFAAPARYEPFGLSVLEAALSGCALVLGDIPSLRELWDDAAVFVPPDDVAALSACLHDLVRHPEMRHEMGVEAQARAAAYRYEDMVDAYLRVYAADVAPRSPSPPDATNEEHGCTS
jgi:glycosyltransferase involved in cell wall biosynthesis